MNDREADAWQAKRGGHKPRRGQGARSQLSGPGDRPWSVPVAVSDIPQTGRRIELIADDATRLAVAKAAGVVAVPRLEAVFDLTPVGEGARVAGRVSAAVEQQCVVTLDPMQSTIDEPVDLAFQPSAAYQPLAADSLATIDAPEPPEDLIGGVIDLGALATEFLILGIDPYPRRPDAAFEAPAMQDDGASHPFAALAALKK